MPPDRGRDAGVGLAAQPREVEQLRNAGAHVGIGQSEVAAEDEQVLAGGETGPRLSNCGTTPTGRVPAARRRGWRGR